MPTANLDKAPRYFRAPKAKGISEEHAQPIDPKGGRYQAGIIRGVSVITVGEALGHKMWIDETTLEQVAEHINRFNKGIKSRYTHPSLSGDGLGKHVARVSDAEVDYDTKQVFADQHFLESAHDTPDGDLAGYLLKLASEDPEGYGLSIVFMHDPAAEELFQLEHSDERGVYTSPDPDNVYNFPHVRIGELRAADAVDEPAANPGGLFSAQTEGIASEADRLAAYALGVTDERPEITQLGMDPDRVRGFAARFLNSRGLTVMSKPAKLNDSPPADDPQPATPAEQQPTGEATPAPTEPAATPEEEKPAETQPAADGQSQQSRQEFGRFREAFGERAGDYFAAGLSFEDAQSRFNVALREENEKLRQQLSAAGHADGETKPLGLAPEGDGARKGSGFASKIRFK